MFLQVFLQFLQVFLQTVRQIHTHVASRFKQQPLIHVPHPLVSFGASPSRGAWKPNVCGYVPRVFPTTRIRVCIVFHVCSMHSSNLRADNSPHYLTSYSLVRPLPPKHAKLCHVAPPGLKEKIRRGAEHLQHCTRGMGGMRNQYSGRIYQYPNVCFKFLA